MKTNSISTEGAIVTVPTWIFRGFTNIGADDGWLFTALGFDNTGGIVWAPTIMRGAREHGLVPVGRQSTDRHRRPAA